MIASSVIRWPHKSDVWDVHITMFDPNAKLKKFVLFARDTKVVVFVLMIFPLVKEEAARVKHLKILFSTSKLATYMDGAMLK